VPGGRCCLVLPSSPVLWLLEAIAQSPIMEGRDIDSVPPARPPRPLRWATAPCSFVDAAVLPAFRKCSARTLFARRESGWQPLETGSRTVGLSVTKKVGMMVRIRLNRVLAIKGIRLPNLLRAYKARCCTKRRLQASWRSLWHRVAASRP
jgi:hypothetical protein